MNSKQTRKARRKFMRDVQPKLIEARLVGVHANTLAMFTKVRNPSLDSIDALIRNRRPK